MRNHLVLSAVLVGLAVAAPAAAQDALPMRLDIAKGLVTAQGGDYVTGVSELNQLVIAAGLKRTKSGMVTVGAAIGQVERRMGLVCYTRPDGSCAPPMRFSTLDLMAGYDQTHGRWAVRTLAGASRYHGDDETSFGGTTRIDLSYRIFGPVILQSSATVAVLPRHQGNMLLFSGSTLGIGIR